MEKLAYFKLNETQQLAAEYIASLHGTGHQEAKTSRILKYVGSNQQQTAFNQALQSIHPHRGDAIMIIKQELASNPAKRLFFASKLKRYEHYYYHGTEKSSALSDWHYRLEGITDIPLGLFHAFKTNFLACVSILSGIAFVASFVPYLAAHLSNLITLISVLGVVKHEVAAQHYEKGTPERQEHLREAGEGWMGVFINTVPLPEVVKHLQQGRQAILGKNETLLHPAELEQLLILEILGAVPAYLKINATMLLDSLKLAGRFLTQPAQTGKAIVAGLKTGLAHDSIWPDTLHQIQTSGRHPLKLLQTLRQTLASQIPLALTLIDEIMVPFVKVMNAFQDTKSNQ